MQSRSFPASKANDTRELLLEGTHALARRLAGDLRAADDNVHLDTIKRDLRTAADILAHGDAAATTAQYHALSNTLRLFHACPRAACRRSRACRGRAQTCLAQADVPDAVLHHAVALMLAQLVPAAAALTGRRADARLAYEAWIAAMEARR